MNVNEIKLQELYSETLEELVKIPLGSYNLNDAKKFWFLRLFQGNRGWLTVAQDADGSIIFSVLSHRDTHDSHWGSARYIDVKKSSDGFYYLKSYMRSVLSVHLVWGYGKGTTVHLVEAFEFATQILSTARHIKILN